MMTDPRSAATRRSTSPLARSTLVDVPRSREARRAACAAAPVRPRRRARARARAPRARRRRDRRAALRPRDLADRPEQVRPGSEATPRSVVASTRAEGAAGPRDGAARVAVDEARAARGNAPHERRRPGRRTAHSSQLALLGSAHENRRGGESCDRDSQNIPNSASSSRSVRTSSAHCGATTSRHLSNGSHAWSAAAEASSARRASRFRAILIAAFAPPAGCSSRSTEPRRTTRASRTSRPARIAPHVRRASPPRPLATSRHA